MRDIPGYEGLYSVTVDGRVWSKPKIVFSRKRKGWFEEGHFLSPNIHYRNSYLSVQLSKEGKLIRKLVHRLVALTYIPNPNNHRVVNHKNSVRSDNRVENLEWCTHSQNSKHAYELGRLKTPGTKYDVRITNKVPN